MSARAGFAEGEGIVEKGHELFGGVGFVQGAAPGDIAGIMRGGVRGRKRWRKGEFAPSAAIRMSLSRRWRPVTAATTRAASGVMSVAAAPIW